MTRANLKTKKTTAEAPEADALAGQVTAALGRAWGAIRERHRELPPAVIILASGDDRRRPRWGHWSASRWDVGGSEAGEVMIAGELLSPSGGNDPELPVERKCLGTELHEAAHALAHVLGIPDTSRGGRYHNKRYRDVAEDVGLEVLEMPPYGWSHTRMTEAAAEAYAEALAELAEVLRGHRVGQKPRDVVKRPQGWLRAVCSCPNKRTIRASRTTLDAAPITCGSCGRAFVGATP